MTGGYWEGELGGARVKCLFHPVAWWKTRFLIVQHHLSSPIFFFSEHMQLSITPLRQSSTDTLDSPSAESRPPHAQAAISRCSSLPAGAYDRTWFRVNSCLPSPESESSPPKSRLALRVVPCDGFVVFADAQVFVVLTLGACVITVLALDRLVRRRRWRCCL